MNRIDQIEMLGAAVEERLITLDAAAELLAELSEGGLTKLGAKDVLGRHCGIREEYRRVFADTSDAIDALEAAQAATTPEEFLRAHNAARDLLSGQAKRWAWDRIRRDDFPGGTR